MQALTAAFSLNGMHALIQWMLGDSMAKALAQLQPPDATVSVPDIVAPTPPINPPPPATTYENITVKLTNGSLTGFAPQYQNLTPGGNGQFTIALVANNATVSYSWNEQYDTYIGFTDMGHTNSDYGYSMEIGTFTFDVPFTISQQAGSYTLTVGTISATPSTLTPHIPTNSILQQASSLPCLPTTVDTSTVQSIDAIDFSTAAKNLLQGMFGTIPASGQLTPDIVFSFAEGTAPLSFDPSGGITVGATGTTTWNGQAYPPPAGTTPPDLAIPSIPATAHVHLFAADYMFNELYWAFQQDGKLNTTIVPGDLPDPDMLNTAYYQTGSMAPLYNKYPNLEMVVNATATQPPTVQFTTCWDLAYGDDGVLTSQEAPLPESVYRELRTLSGAVYLTQADYEAALGTALGPDMKTYGAQIVAASVVAGPFTQPYQVTAAGLSALQANPKVPSGVYEAIAGAFVAGQGYPDKSWLLVALDDAFSVLPDPPDLDTYGPLVEAAFAYTGSCAQVWWVTPGTTGALTALVDLLPPDIYNDITSLNNIVFLTTAELQTSLENAISQDAGQYIPTIQKAAQVNGAIAQHFIEAEISVMKGGSQVYCFTFQVSETDFQQAFRLGHSGYNQTVQFDFQLIGKETTATLVSSKISGITADDFGSVWNFGLQPVYAIEMQKMAHTGVPIPFMTGMQFLFDEATVVIQPGYADVTADILYRTSSAPAPLGGPEQGGGHRTEHRDGRRDEHRDVHERGHRSAGSNGRRSLHRGATAAAETRLARGNAR